MVNNTYQEPFCVLPINKVATKERVILGPIYSWLVFISQLKKKLIRKKGKHFEQGDTTVRGAVLLLTRLGIEIKQLYFTNILF
jgi:hypothetical protein